MAIVGTSGFLAFSWDCNIRRGCQAGYERWRGNEDR